MVTVLVRHQSHDGRGADGDGFRRAQEAVDEAAQERTVQTVLKRTGGGGTVRDTFKESSTQGTGSDSRWPTGGSAAGRPESQSAIYSAR